MVPALLLAMALLRTDLRRRCGLRSGCIPPTGLKGRGNLQRNARAGEMGGGCVCGALGVYGGRCSGCGG